ncbi:hypothetical protein Q604_UNBC14470G0001, partial [human gut metagenome]
VNIQLSDDMLSIVLKALQNGRLSLRLLT